MTTRPNVHILRDGKLKAKGNPRKLAQWLKGCVAEVDYLNITTEMAARGVLNKRNVEDWLARTIAAIYSHADYHKDATEQFGLSPNTFKELMLAALVVYHSKASSPVMLASISAKVKTN